MKEQEMRLQTERELKEKRYQDLVKRLSENEEARKNQIAMSGRVKNQKPLYLKYEETYHEEYVVKELE